MNHGIKADNLMQLREMYPDNVPPFEVVPFEEIIQSYEAILQRIDTLFAQGLKQNLSASGLEAQIHDISESVKINKDALFNCHRKIIAHGWAKVSIRTSALLEDGEKQSFAGQYVSFIDVTYDQQKLERYVLECFRSLFSARVINYAKTHRLKTFSIGGSAIVQKMFYGQKSGVLFTEDGQGKMTFAITDSWRNGAVEGDDARVVKVPKVTLKAPGITRQLQQIANIGIQLEMRYNKPLDIEWAHDAHSIMLLQMRPQTTDTTAYSLTWDGTNISENYPGVTLPLTYSFIKNVYAHVYPSFFRLMGMSEKKLKKNSQVFDNALGYINGRVYYRIENWYELVRLIPGSRNQDFFEAMLNPAKKRAKSDRSSKISALVSPSFWLLTLRFTWLLLRSGTHSRSFAKRLVFKFDQYKRVNWSAMTGEATLDHLREIREELLVMWGVPILNDVRVMIFHGIFKTILLKDADAETYLNHLKGLTDQASIKPLQALHALGGKIDHAMMQQKAKRVEDLQQTKSWSNIETAAQAFINTFGGRTPDELQLENPRLSENIWDILHLAYATKDADLFVSKPSISPRFNNFPIHKRFFARFIAHNVRQAIDYRERFRFNRAQIFGIARIAYLALGEKLTDATVIKHREDIFWLTEQEIEAVIRGHSWSYDLHQTVAQRKTEYDSYNKKPFWLRVSGNGMVAPKFIKKAMPKNVSSRGIAGDGVAAGKVTAQIVVVHTFDPQLDVTNKILVVRHIDPGWTLLLVQAAGVITEQGNPLSHVAIVAREICIPAVVGVKDAVKNFKTGDTITMNGSTGEVISES